MAGDEQTQTSLHSIIEQSARVSAVESESYEQLRRGMFYLDGEEVSFGKGQMKLKGKICYDIGPDPNSKVRKGWVVVTEQKYEIAKV